MERENNNEYVLKEGGKYSGRRNNADYIVYSWYWRCHLLGEYAFKRKENVPSSYN